MFGVSPAQRADESGLDLSDAQRYLYCLSSISSPHADSGITPVLSHVTYAFLIVAADRDLIKILEVMSGMPFVHQETQVSGVSAVIVTGAAGQWKDAVRCGTTPFVDRSVRACLGDVMVLFEQEGLSLWKDCDIKPQRDNTFLLEDRRK